MLEYNREDDLMRHGLANHLCCNILVPSCLSDFFNKHTSGAVVADDRRRYKRWHFRDIAALEIRQSLKYLERMPSWHRVYTKDIAIGGLSFLHSEQLFPMEQMKVMLLEKSVEPIFRGRNRNIIEVMRCRKWGDQCYEIGAQFIDEFRD